ncbi:SDR family oxidoreductase [uncultured Bacteroides sp.]|uniref:SDR family oxidoreductase n=1 Tax=uncultured Bacteroides sp. TaxID=162156 RepID=UPI00280BCAA0|nr:SDR family oxidoreductase [uncultured Bacteroides sp.]
MKALFIGGTGTISTDVVALAQQRGWEITLLNRGSKKVPEGTRSIIADINDEEAVAKAIANENYDVVAQFIGYTAEDVQRDIRLFRNKTKQYIFISSASAYQKPLADYCITESTPLSNPYWQYSRNKIEAEEVLMSAYRSDGFPVTIVRPSHTYNGTKPPVCVHGSKGNWQILKRILDGKPVIIPGDGTSLWTLTHSKDFAKGYVGLMANPHAIGNAFHITTDESMTWNQIYQTIADTLGKPLNALHVPSDFLARHGENYDFKGELLGDKASTVVFDNSKIKRLVPDFVCNISMADGLRQAVQFMLAHPETQTPDLEFDSWCDRIADSMRAADEAFLKNSR